MRWEFQQLTAVQLAAAIAPQVPLGSQHAIMQANGGTVRARWDGIDPSATVGLELQDGGDWLQVDALILSKARFISGGGAPTLDMHFLITEP